MILLNIAHVLELGPNFSGIRRLRRLISQSTRACFSAEKSIGGIGGFQKDMTALGVVMANGVRIGLEDNIWYDNKRTEFATNEKLVRRIIDLAKVLDRPIATANHVRQMLNLQRR